MKRLPWAERDLIYRVLGFEPLPPQLELLTDDSQFLAFAGGVGCGKSFISGKVAIPEVVRPERGRYWVVSEGYDNSREEFTFLCDDVERLGMKFKRGPNMPKEGSWDFMLETGTTVETRSTANVDSLHSVAVDGLIIAEAGLQRDGWCWENRLLPRLVRANGWAFLSGTFEGASGWWYHIFNLGQTRNLQGWKSHAMASWQNTVKYPLGEKEEIFEVARRQTDPETFMERYGAIPKKPSLLVFKEFDAKAHTADVPYDPNLPVYLGVDPGGVNPYAVVVIQLGEGEQIRVIDEVYTSGMLTEEIIKGSNRFPSHVPLEEREWWENLKGGAIDATADTERARWVMYGKIFLMARKVDIEAGITRLKDFLRMDPYNLPKLVIDYRCKRTIAEFGMYKRRPPSSDMYELNETPIDSFNHSVKALVYFIVNHFGSAVKLFEPYVVQAIGGGDRFAHLR